MADREALDVMHDEHDQRGAIGLLHGKAGIA
jgi:hypothetical protein